MIETIAAVLFMIWFVLWLRNRDRRSLRGK